MRSRSHATTTTTNNNQQHQQPPPTPCSQVGPGEAKGENDREVKMNKMKQDFVLGMLAQSFLPCSVRNVSTLMKNEGWTSTMDSHWYEVIKALFNEGS